MAQRARRRKRAGRAAKGAAGPGPARYEASVSTVALPRTLLCVALALLACHAGLKLYHYRVDELSWLLIQLFDVNQENNLPTWFSQFLLLVAAALLWLCGQQRRAEGGRWAGHWRVLAVGFLLLSVDEVAGVHESINSVIVITWAIPAGIAALLIGAAFIPFLLHLPRRTALLFALAGAIYLAGAAGLEILGNSMVRQGLKDTLQYSMQALAEEGLEMGGILLFLYALLDYMRGPVGGDVRASLEVA